jgi:hypothetical protein
MIIRRIFCRIKRILYHINKITITHLFPVHCFKFALFRTKTVQSNARHDIPLVFLVFLSSSERCNVVNRCKAPATVHLKKKKKSNPRMSREDARINYPYY